MAQLNQYNGGLNIRLAPHLINTNEAQVYVNVEPEAISLKPIKGDTNESQEVYQFMYNFNDSWISSPTYKTYQEFQEKLYYSDGVGIPQKSSDGTTWFNLGIKESSSKPITSISGSGVLDGTIQYAYTYYNINDGTESKPSEYSTELSVSSQSVNIDVTASTDPQVTNIRLYRLGGNLTSMQLVVELDNTTQTYTDNIGDLDIIGDVLDSYNNGQAPEGLSYLTENNAMFFGSVKDKLWYSDIAYVNNWSSFNFIDFDQPITAIGAVPNGLLVFTEFKTYIVTGTSPDTLSKYLLSANQGCIDHRSIKYAKNTLLWLSSDGVCASSGGDIQVISRDKLGNSYVPSTINDTIVYDDVYYIAHSQGILVADFRFGLIFRNIDTIVDGFDIYNDVLYYSKDNNLYSLGTSTEYKTLDYKSPKLSDGQVSNLKNYKSIYVRCLGTLQISISIDGILVTTKSIDSSTSEILIPQLSRKGYCIEFEVTGTGELLELQYVVEGRQNGK